MQILLEVQINEVWNAIKNGPFIPINVIGMMMIRVKYYLIRRQNIIAYSLRMNTIFRVCNCKTPQEIWDTLKVTHEGKKIKKIQTKHFIPKIWEV